FYLFYEFVLPSVFQWIGPPRSGEALIDGERPAGGEGPRWMRDNPKWMKDNLKKMKRPFFNPFRRMRMYYAFVQMFAIYFLSTAFKTSQIALQREREASELKSENLNSELKFLRSQINPHFLFNALNNIYSLSVIRSEKTPDNILKLSGMLRYIIYDCNSDRVPLEKEINYINNYIDLQKLKDDQITNIDVDFGRADPKSMIAPMIFIPFIENSFKHSKIEDVELGWIKISIESANNHLLFRVENSLPKEHYTKDKVGGVGLENVKRRLELLYPNAHRLRINTTEDKFQVELEVTLDVQV
ncbi:MAG: histidine kinase, partial [Cytophagales bacterium]|nr:histidine kinase [Cytophagales bacterium]